MAIQQLADWIEQVQHIPFLHVVIADDNWEDEFLESALDSLDDREWIRTLYEHPGDSTIDAHIALARSFLEVATAMTFEERLAAAGIEPVSAV